LKFSQAADNIALGPRWYSCGVDVSFYLYMVAVD